jgi:dihydropyrimidinase
VLDLIISGGHIVNADGSVDADIGIKDGKIACIGRKSDFGQAVKTIDASGKLVMPGLIDSHVHIDDAQGEFFTKDQVETGTIAAAYGGTTTMVQFAIPVGDERPIQALEKRMHAAKDVSVIDYSFHGAITHLNDQSLADVRDILTGGFPSIKMFTVYRGEVMLEQLGIYKVLQLIGKHCGVAKIHAENADMIEANVAEYVRRGLTTPYYHPLTRPPVTEVTAVANLLPMIEETDAATVFVHMTTSQVCDYIRWAKKRMPVFTEFCPHYLTLTEQVYSRPDAQNYMCNPPMRAQADQDGLWKMVSEGLCDVINSDHSCFDLAQKASHKDDFTKEPNGLPGIETRAAIIFSEGVAKGRITENDFVRMLSTNDAKLMGMFPQKGILAAGSDADIVLWDPNASYVLHAGDLHMGTDYTPFEDFHITGKLTHTLIRGNIIVEDGKFVGDRFKGRMVRRGVPILG